MGYRKFQSIILILLLTSYAASLISQCPIQLSGDTEIRNDFRNHQIDLVGNLYSYPDRSFLIDGMAQFPVGFTSSLWISAFDPQGNLKVAANNYVSVVSSDFIAGPYKQDAQDYQSHCEFYARIWKVTKEEVEKLQEDFNNGNLDVSNIPRDILDWPAKGNPHIGEFTPEYDMAPFYDFSEDDVYDPLSGDYPLALVENINFLPHEMAFTIYNDNTAHTSSMGDPLKLEFHQLDFVIDCELDRVFERTVFTRLKYIYHGLEDLMNFSIGIWEDVDLGCYEDDRIGCDTLLNTSYTYNANGVDASPCEFGNSIPNSLGVIQTKIQLNNELKRYTYNLTGMGNNTPVAMQSPSSPEEFHNFLNAFWRDGTPFTLGGLAYNPGSNEVIQYVYPDLPTENNGWSLELVDPPPVDFNNLSVVIDEDLISPGATGVIDFADHVIYDGVSQGFEIFDRFESEVLDVQKAYDDLLVDNFSCALSLSNSEVFRNDGILTFPNPVNSVLHIRNVSKGEGVIRVYNVSGQEVFNAQKKDEKEQIELDFSQLEEGLYFLYFVGLKGENQSTSFIKM